MRKPSDISWLKVIGWCTKARADVLACVVEQHVEAVRKTDEVAHPSDFLCSGQLGAFDSGTAFCERKMHWNKMVHRNKKKSGEKHASVV